jgi:DMSO/TMAO reductase YedYZ molybdopterin-dependent catalytic subunit
VTDRLVVVRADPFNAEAPLTALDAFITPIETFYVRSNFAVPRLDPGGWKLRVDGLVERPQTLSLADLDAGPTSTITCTLECAGNNRRRLSPAPEGEPWGVGAISTAEFSGVPLSHVLHRAGVRPGAVEVRFEGADSGVPQGRVDTVRFERSLPTEVAFGDDVLIATAMGGRPLTPDHGAPARLLVPGWYGMASVKWLTRIEVLDHALEAHFQTDRYRYHPAAATDDQPPPAVTTIRVNSMITSISPDIDEGSGARRLEGAAWCGTAAIAAVDVSIDDGPWRPAELIGERYPRAWRRWRFDWEAPVGRHALRSRATAADGATQPDEPEWNRLGYGNNAIATTLVDIVTER